MYSKFDSLYAVLRDVNFGFFISFSALESAITIIPSEHTRLTVPYRHGASCQWDEYDRAKMLAVLAKQNKRILA